MLVPNFVEEVDLALRRKQRDGQRMDRRVAPSLVVEAALSLEVIEVGRVGLAAPEVHVRDFEV